LNILLTGGLGYIGRHAALVFENVGYKVFLFDNLSNSDKSILLNLNKVVEKEIILIEGDVRDTELLSNILYKHKIEAVIHFAGLKAVNESITNPIEYFDNNVGGTLSIIKALQKNKIKKFIFSSSATVYGEPLYLPIDELHPRSPINPYGESKFFVENILKDLSFSDPSFSIAVLRYFNPAGAHDSGLIGENSHSNFNNLMPNILKSIKNSKPFKIFGDDYETKDGTCERDYIHVMDLAEGHLAAFKFIETNTGCNSFNLGTGEAFSVLDIIRKFCEVNQIKIDIEKVQRRDGDVAISFASVEKAEKILKWKSQRTLADICISAWKSSKN